MPYSPLISKIRVHNPNKKGSSNANRNYVTYIATREGVSLETIRNVNDLLATEGIMEKELREELVHQEADNKNYVEYIARRPRSQGLFGNIDTDDLKEVSSEIAKLTQQGRIIYRGIISLSERDAEELGFRDINAWNNYLRRVMPDIAEKLGVSSYNHTWVAAFHAEESHPHVHYMLWDNKDKVKSPYIHTATQQKIRILLEKEMFDNVYERSIKMAYKPEFDDLNKSRNLERTKILDETQELMKRTGFVPGVEYEKLPSRVSNDYLRKIADETQKLIMNLPGKGSFKYDYLTPDVKGQLNKVIDLVLEKKDIKASLDSYLQHVEEGQKLQGRTATKIEFEVGKEEQDIRKRIGNKILKEIRGVVLEVFPPENEMEREIEKQALIESEVSEDNNMYETLDAAMKSKYFLEWNDNYKRAMDLLYGDETDIQGAFDILENEAISGNALAIFEAGKMIDRELLEMVELQEANEYFDEARGAFERIYSTTDNDYKKQYAAYRLGKIYMSALGSISEADYKEAEKWLKRAPENKYAQYTLGKLYLTDKIYVSEREDTLENKEAALELFDQSAEGKNPFASYELGKMYSQGIGTDIDIAKAQDHYKGALAGFLQMAEKGTDDALFYRLGRMYLDGLGTEVDEQEGEKYICKAAKLGNEAAKLSLATIYLKKDDEDLKQQAIRSLKEMADGDSKHPMAQYKLGAIYADKEKLPEYYDIEKAISYLERSAESRETEVNGERKIEPGNQYAQYLLGVIYANPENEEEGCYNLQKAIGYFEEAEEQGNQFAQYRLGCIYEDKTYMHYNMDTAIRYFTRAAHQGNQYAQCRLGCIYYFGKGVPKNEELGKMWLQSAAEQGNQFAKDVLENQVVGINFSYCLLKGMLSSMETLNRQTSADVAQARTQSKQAMREKHLHYDREQGKNQELE